MNKLEAARKKINIIKNEIQDRSLEIITVERRGEKLRKSK